jgi:hypothetical protein
MTFMGTLSVFFTESNALRNSLRTLCGKKPDKFRSLPEDAEVIQKADQPQKKKNQTKVVRGVSVAIKTLYVACSFIDNDSLMATTLEAYDKVREMLPSTKNHIVRIYPKLRQRGGAYIVQHNYDVHSAGTEQATTGSYQNIDRPMDSEIRFRARRCARKV